MAIATDGLVGSYRIVGKIAEGGMGTVFEAVHVGLDKRVALKTLRAEIAGDPEMLARFLEEGRAASRLRHPNVIDVTDVGVHEGTPFLVMELLEGESLAERLARQAPLGVEETAAIVLPLLDALATAHDVGIVHRDLKPQNVFLARVRSSIVPKVLDFGISRVRRDDGAQLTQGAALLGTPRYMAPEQVRDARQVDARTDVFALGLVVYEMLTGVAAIRGESLGEVVHAIVSGEIVPPSRLRPELEGDVEAIVLRMLALRPTDRFESMRAIGAAMVVLAAPSVRQAWSSAFEGTMSGDALAGTAIAPAAAATPSSVRSLACPPLVASGVPEPSHWLGVAAAHAIGRRARWLFGGRASSVDTPVVLAGLPSEPSGKYSASPFDDAATRAAAEAAAAKAAHVLRGTVERRRGRLHLRVELVSGTRSSVHVEADRVTLAEAARALVLALGDRLGWDPVHEDAVEAYGVTDARAGVYVEDLLAEMDGLEPADVPEAERANGRLGAIGAALEIGRERADAVVDETSPATRAWTSYAVALRARGIAPELEKTLKSDIEAARSNEAQAAFRALGALRAMQTDPERAWSLALRATQIEPRSLWAWRALGLVTPVSRITSAHAFRVMAWCPDSRVILAPEPDVEREWGAALTWRANIMKADGWSAMHLPLMLVNTDEVVRTEEFIGELDDRPGMELYAAHGRAQVEMHQARFTPALERFRSILREDDVPLGRVIDAPCLFFSVELGAVLGCEQEVADEILTRRLLGTIAPAPGAAKGIEMIMLHVVTHASPEVGRAAVARLRELAAQRVFRWQLDIFEPCLTATEHWMHGRTAQIAAPVRTIANVREFGPTLARIFDAAGRADLAERADQKTMDAIRSLAGLSAGHLRTARRLAATGRLDEARALAQRIADAWSVAEDDVPAVIEMRALARGR